MNKYLALILTTFLISYNNGYGQVYSLNNGFTNGGQINTCAGLFKDSNPGGSYSNNESYSVTIAPGTPASAIELRFDTLALGLGDTLFIYDGINVLASSVAIFIATSGPTSVRGSAANTSGALTIRFKSDNTTTLNGWSASIRCKPPCQKIVASVFATSPQVDAQGFISICTGQSILFKGKGNYIENDVVYHQSDTLSRFSWRVTDNRDTSGIFLDSFRHRFSREGGFLVELKITDTAGCINNEMASVKVRTGIRPQFNISTPIRNCSTDTIRVSSRPQMVVGSFSNPPIIADSIFLPDGTNVAYQTTLNINQFSPGQTLNNINDLRGILVNMEHSWLGDIEISIKAPNGATARLKYSTGVGTGWESFLGEPVDEPSATHPFSQVAGKGYSYVFSPNPTFGTMAAEKGKYRYSYVDNAGQVVNNHTYLPAGSYASEESLSQLLGTPLNGQWTITVVDKFAVDNGFMFYWTIQFNPLLYPNSEIYSTTFNTGAWSPALNIVSGTDSAATIVLNAPGTFPFTYTVTDAFGCRHDTTFNLVVLQKPAKPNLGRDTAVCNGQSVTLQVGNVQTGQTYVWNTGNSGVTNINVLQPGTYTVVTTNLPGCTNTDTVIVNPSTPYTISLGNDTSFCLSNPNVLTPAASIAVSSLLWNNGTSANLLPITSPGLYWVEATNQAGCKVRDTIVVSNNPVNTFSLPPDTAICELTTLRLTVNPPTATTLTWSNGTTGNTNTLGGGTHSLIANNIGCLRTSQINVRIKPLPRFTPLADTSICEGFTVPLRVAHPGASYLWSSGSTDSTIAISRKGTYWAQTTLAGCTYRDSMELQYRNCSCDVKIPNAFSPNGDGINDYLVPKIECFPSRFQLLIFNRYGQQVFDTRDFKTQWNGKMSGKDLAVGTYYYILTFFNENLRKDEKFTGSITLLR